MVSMKVEKMILSYPILFITIVPTVDSSRIQSVRSTRITVTIILEVAWS